MLIAQSLWRNTAEAAAAIVQLSRVRDAIRVFPPASLFVGCCLLASRRSVHLVGSSRQQLLRHPEEKKGLEDFFKLRNP